MARRKLAMPLFFHEADPPWDRVPVVDVPHTIDPRKLPRDPEHPSILLNIDPTRDKDPRVLDSDAPEQAESHFRPSSVHRFFAASRFFYTVVLILSIRFTGSYF